MTETSGTTTRLPENTSLSPARACSTMSLRKMTSMVRGKLPAGTCVRMQLPAIRASCRGEVPSTPAVAASTCRRHVQAELASHCEPYTACACRAVSARAWEFEWHEQLTSSVVSCTLARCQSMKVLSSFSRAQLFLHRQK